MKYYKIVIILIFCIMLYGCGETHDCNDHISDWIEIGNHECGISVVKYKKCLICEEKIVEETFIREHEYIETIVQEMTCKQDKIVRYDCKLCGESKTDIIPTTGHSYVEEVIQEQTCLENGIVMKYCTLCNATTTSTIPTPGHQYEQTILKEVTCTEDGIYQYTCINCEEVYNETKTKLGHDYKEPIKVKNPTCTEMGLWQYTCSRCEITIDELKIATGHKYSDAIVAKEASCTEEGLLKYICETCEHVREVTTSKTEHKLAEAVVIQEPTDKVVGKRTFSCSECSTVLKTQNFVNNGYFKHGKLSVVNRDLVNQYGEKVQLYGISTHGMQWFGRYANFDTIAAIQEAFGINIIRFAMYTAEGGYCEGNDIRKKQMLDDLFEGVDAATKLGLYVIIDWHMVGATNIADKNPLTYLKESKEFFNMVSEKYKDQDNILFEIMNEPNGSTTWTDCKKYAEEVIPEIRKNSDGIVLVGNPKWTADLRSVMKNPLLGQTNIMYTYHFYARDHSNTSQVVEAYDSGFPVFISEFGFMNSSGDGAISETNGNKWKAVLDARNISHVAWNISNSQGSASIFKYGSSDMTSVEDSNLKEWGIYLKKWYREKSGLDKLELQ